MKFSEEWVNWTIRSSIIIDIFGGPCQDCQACNKITRSLYVCSGPPGEQRVDLAGLQVRRGGGRKQLQNTDGMQLQAVFSCSHKFRPKSVISFMLHVGHQLLGPCVPNSPCHSSLEEDPWPDRRCHLKLLLHIHWKEQLLQCRYSNPLSMLASINS
jgi:hypothetical protein